MQATFPGNLTVELPHAKHYFQGIARRPVRGPRCKRLACQRRRGQGEHGTRDEQHQDKETSNMS